MRVRRDLGDFQTPRELAEAVLETLGPVAARAARVLEPTCGNGQFVASLLQCPSPPREIKAIEIQERHCQKVRALVADRAHSGTRVEIIRANFFDLDLRHDLSWSEQGPLLVIGNPPWVTNSELGALGSTSRLTKRNLKGLPGIEARTGASNFDLAEAVWLKLLFELADQAPTVALLCKMSVARGVLQFGHRARLGIAEASIHRIDAARWFGAAVQASLLCLRMGRKNRRASVPVYSGLNREEPEKAWGFARGWLVADRDAYGHSAHADGACPRTWRQGLKHDAATVMELTRDPVTGSWHNREGEIVDVEADFVYPQVKGADLKRAAHEPPARAVIVTQKRIGDDTTCLAETAPRLWGYLQARGDCFTRRKSSIYRGQPPYAIFGVGAYSFATFKVAISGLHKRPAFRALGPIDGRPVMLDDTCYFLPCESAAETAVLTALCNDPATLDFLRSAVFPDAKRPVTKTLLQRVDLGAILKRTERDALLSRAARVLETELAARSDTPLSRVIECIEREFSCRPRAARGRRARRDLATRRPYFIA
jgi:hypothetical protein